MKKEKAQSYYEEIIDFFNARVFTPQHMTRDRKNGIALQTRHFKLIVGQLYKNVDYSKDVSNNMNEKKQCS